MKRATTILLLSVLLTGCNVPSLFPGAKPTSSAVNQPVEPLGGITFSPVSASNARLLGNASANATAGPTGGSAESAVAPSMGAPTAGAPAMDASAGAGVRAPAPTPGAAPKSAGGAAFSGNVNGYYGVYGYGYGGYGGGSANGEPMALVSITQAQVAGASGSFQQVVKGVVAPVLKDWAGDGRLIQSSATLGNDGGAYKDGAAQAPSLVAESFPYYGDAPGWRLVYFASSRSEMLHFYVTPTKTLILRQRWAPLDLDPTAVRIDSAAAIKSLVAAIETAGFKSEEEKSGIDYFLGTAFEQAQAPDAYGGRTEVIMDVPDNARWGVQLQSTLGKMVWALNYYTPDAGAYPMVGRAEAVGGSAGGSTGNGTVMVDKAPFSVLQETFEAKPMQAPAPGMPYVDPGFWTNNAGSGLVDAQSGAVIRFSRPYRQYYNTPMPAEPPRPDMPKPTDPVAPTSGGTP